uniref:Uncharacterized protein n=1 Tax=Lepeophtheirus salmonis TaxID=72036 RepID=A0A0K2V7R8_LEPSM
MTISIRRMHHPLLRYYEMTMAHYTQIRDLSVIEQ